MSLQAQVGSDAAMLRCPLCSAQLSLATPSGCPSCPAPSMVSSCPAPYPGPAHSYQNSPQPGSAQPSAALLHMAREEELQIMQELQSLQIKVLQNQLQQAKLQQELICSRQWCSLVPAPPARSSAPDLQTVLRR